MTLEEKQKLTEQLYKKPIGELIEMIIEAQEDLEEAKDIRKRLIQIRNIVLNQEERRRPGRPSKGESDALLFGSSNRDRGVSIANK